MPEYGVDTDQWQPLPWSWAAERLATSRNFWVVTVSAAGRPHALPVWGVWDDGDQRFAFACAASARKARNLAANPQAVVAGEDSMECISVEGLAVPVTDVDRAAVWVDRYLAKYQPFSAELTPEFLGQNVLFELTPERAFAVIEREEEFATRATRWVW